MKLTPLAIAVALIVASASVPFLAGPQGSVDDGLFAHLALNIVRSGWLVPYDELTLAKGPIYPLFLAASFLTGLPFLASQAALYAACSLALARAIGLLSHSRIIELVSAVLLLLNPALFAMDMLHVNREGIYVSLTILVIALGLFFHIKKDIGLGRRILLACGAGAHS